LLNFGLERFQASGFQITGKIGMNIPKSSNRDTVIAYNPVGPKVLISVLALPIQIVVAGSKNAIILVKGMTGITRV
jgi:hypothetical protein